MSNMRNKKMPDSIPGNMPIDARFQMPGKKPKPKLSPAQFAARLEAEKVLVRRHYCEVFKMWRTCPLKSCRRRRACHGDTMICLARLIARVPRLEQYQARRRLLEATPDNIGAPELKARQYMPRDFYERR